MNPPSLHSISNNNQVRNPILQAILIIVIVVLFGWFIVIPKSAQLSQSTEQLELLETQRQTLEDDEQAVNKLVAELETSSEKIKLVDEALPLSNRPTKIALLLEEYARSSGMQVAQINIDDVDSGFSAGNKELLSKPYDAKRSLITTNVTVSVGGTTEQFKNFLSLLETSGRIIDVESFNVSSSDNAIKYTLKLLTYAFEVK